MGLGTTLRRAGKAWYSALLSKNQILAGIEAGEVAGSRYAMQGTGDYLGAMGRSGWVYSCVDTIASALAVPAWWFERAEGQRREQDRVKIPDLAKLLRRPTPYHTWAELLYVTAAHLELAGEAYWYLSEMTLLSQYRTEKDADGRVRVATDADGRAVLKVPGNPVAGGQPQEIWYLQPDCVTPKAGGPGELFSSFTYEPTPGHKYELPGGAVIYFRRMDPASMTNGLGVIEAARLALEVDYRASEWNRRYFKQGARPEGALETDARLDRAQIEEIRAGWTNRYSGQENVGKTPVLTEGLKYKAIQASPKDMDWIEQRRFTRDEILAMFRVPPALVGIFEQSKSMANTQEQERFFWAHTMRPLMTLIADRLSVDLVPRWAGDVDFVFQDMVQADLALQSQTAQRLVQTGAMSPNEVRHQFGWGEAYRGGEGHYLPAALVRIDVPAGPAAPAQTPAEDVSAEPEPAPEETPAPEPAPEDVGKAAGRKHAPRLAGKALTAEEQARWRRPMQAEMTRYFQAQEREVVRAVRESPALAELAGKAVGAARPKADTPGDDVVAIVSRLTDWDGQERLLEEGMEPPISEALGASGQQALLDLGLDAIFDLGAPAVQQWLASYLPRLAGSVNDTTRADIARALADGIAEGESIPKLADRVRDVFRQCKEYRAEMIARSESARAYTHGDIEAWRQSGVVEAKVWMAAPDCCEYCQEMDGTQVGLDEPFFEQGSSLTLAGVGTMEFDYEDVDGPPAHPNCRCTTQAVLKEVEE